MVSARLHAFDGLGEPKVVELDGRVFEADVNVDLLYRAVRIQLMNKRQGTACTKTRGEVRGGGRKPWRQKGTGRARAGSRRSPLWPGGGITFGPRPRTYDVRLNKKMMTRALSSALSDRARESRVALLDRMGFEAPKTKTAVSLLTRMEMLKTTLVVVGTTEYVQPVRKSFSNLPGVKCLAAAGLNPYDVLRHEGLVLTISAMGELLGRFEECRS
jgi:large subunit ribosomal protein L4